MRISSGYFATVGRVTWIPASSSFLAICSSVSGFEESSSSIIFLTSRFNVSSDMSPPSGPFTDSLKNERSSRTPCGVCAVASKYADTPQGVLELRSFFSESVNGPEGGGLSLLTLKRLGEKKNEEKEYSKAPYEEAN